MKLDGLSIKRSVNVRVELLQESSGKLQKFDMHSL